MREKIAEKTFEVLFAVEDLREILRKTAPFDLTKEQIEEAKKILAKIRKALDEIEGELK